MNRFEHNETEWNPSEERQVSLQERLEARKRRKNRTIGLYIIACSSVIIIILVALAVGLDMFVRQTGANGTITSQNSEMTEGGSEIQTDTEEVKAIQKPEWDEQLLTPNPNSRPGDKLVEVTGIVVHYVGNPNTTAKQNRDYFEDLAITQATSASSHFVVGLEGEILQCMPLNEVAYASKHRNADTISIEVCHPTEDGKFTKETYKAVVALVAWLVVEYDLAEDEVIRHYDVTGKECPKYYVQYESAWEDFKLDVWAYIDKNSEIITK